MPPCPIALLAGFRKKNPVGKEQAAGMLVLPGEASVPASGGAAAPMPDPSEPPGSRSRQRAGARLPMPFLFGSAHSYFKSGLGLSQGHYRVSSLAFAPIAEKQVQCRALGFLNSCRGRNLSQQSCRGRAGTQRGLCAGRRGVEGRVATLYARGSRPLGGRGR